MINPLYLVDFEKGDKALIYNRKAKTFIECKRDEFATLEWMNEIGSIGMEAAHGARISKWSKSQWWDDEDDLRSFWKTCEKKGSKLRFLPEKSIPRYRDYLSLNKSGNSDLLAWDNAITNRPDIWKVAQRPENVRFYDRAKQISELIKEHGPTKQLAGFYYREQLKDASREQSANDLSYKESPAGKIIWNKECLSMIADRLESHTSNDSNIHNGMAEFVFEDGTKTVINLLDILGFEKSKKGTWKNPKKETQIISCGMLFIDSEGNRYINIRTGKYMSWKDVKQYGMVSSAFHQKPGFLRVKWYHHGIKPIIKKYLIDKFGTITVKSSDGDEYEAANIDWTNLEQEKFFRWIRNICRIAYEQTAKAIVQYLNEIERREILFG